jgi:ubiquinol-cytochrome c reductase cytochrome c subunit
MQGVFARLVWAGLVVALMAGAARAQDAPAGDGGKGKELYFRDGCYYCHGYVGQGSRMAGPRVAPMALPFDAFKTQLRTPSNEMPPYTSVVITDAQVADIYAFLHSIPGPTHAAKDIPLLNR